MQLFAIIAKVDFVEEKGTVSIESSNARRIIEAFLRSELSTPLVKKYIDMFDTFLKTHHDNSKKKDRAHKRTSVNSVKVLKISSQINKELTQRQKVIVLLRILEFIHSSEIVTQQENDFVNTVAESFNVDTYEYEAIRKQVISEVGEVIDFQDFLYVARNPHSYEFAHAIQFDNLDGIFRVLYVKSVNTIIFKYFGSDELNINGQLVPNDRNHILNQGSTVKTSRTLLLYYSDIISKFLNDTNKEKILFTAKNVSYRFKSGKIGLQKINLQEQSGKLVGLMGASGSGKSTLLNVLNGNYIPSEGSVTINNIDIHREKTKLEGVIGFISQDDLLIEELTIFQNLFFNAQLCFNDLDDQQITKKVMDLLILTGLQGVMHLKVGSPLEKTISGGQRKRLNIALELIREPSVLFVDEPTSGLSSRDSENIMDMLKELALKGKLVFVVIHQPSSDIFKMFDKMLILDQGGYPIFEGNPIDAVVYFKTCVNHVNAYERECITCGNVNPEQIFNIIETKVIDEYGNSTRHRKISPAEWNEKFLQQELPKEEPPTQEILETPVGSSKPPCKLKQFRIFFKRDVLSKLANLQYILINMLEAPFLALILAFFVKYYNSDENRYIFAENENLPQFLFIAVVVAIFLGLSVAAEEIIKDKKILKRESFLNLSRRSYLLSKLSIMFIISSIQMLFFVLIGNYILEIKGMWLEYWFILFSTSCYANVVGLIISATFNSVKVIYITIPVLVIPQLLFSGVIVKFDKLHPIFSHPIEVPLIGNIMISRWSYEALVVTQAKQNYYMRQVYQLEKQKSKSSWKKDYWIPEMENKVAILFSAESKAAEKQKAKLLLINEIKKEQNNWANLNCEQCIESLEHFKPKEATEKLYPRLINFLSVVQKEYNKIYDEKSQELEQYKIKIGLKKIQQLQEEYQNKSLHELVTNKNELHSIIEIDNQLFQKENPIYLLPEQVRFFDTHFYAPSKFVFRQKVDTFWANMLVTWAMTFLLMIALYYDWLKKLLDFGGRIFEKIKK